MRIKGKTQKSIWPEARRLIILFLVAISLFLLFKMVFGNQKQEEETWSCNMETVLNIDGEIVFKNDNTLFLNGSTQSDITAFSGKFSSKCNFENPAGPELSLTGLLPGQIIETTIWRKSDSGLGHLVIKGSWGVLEKFDHIINSRKGWQQLKGKIIIPPNVENDTLTIYPFFNGKNSAVFFDQFETKRYPPKKLTNENKFFNEETLEILLDNTGYNKLKNKRKEAIIKKQLITEKGDFTNARLKTNNQEIDVLIRLKGDLMDHFRDEKWSFRINSQNQESWRGMPEFSVHNPHSRSHLDEWIFHQILLKEGVMTTRYDFINLALNDNALGSYAWEEHFTKSVVENNQRPAGPIFRLNEDGYWANIFEVKDPQVAWFESANFEPFEKDLVLKNKSRKEQFLTAQDLLAGFIAGQRDADAVFDLDAMAKFIAISDILIAAHTLNYNNLRFYFNPITSKIEPVGFDGYTEQGTHYYDIPYIAGEQFNERFPQAEIRRKYLQLQYRLFNDMTFMAKYLLYLEKYSAKAYLEEVRAELQHDIAQRATFIRKDYPEYRFDWKFYTRNAEAVAKLLHPLKALSVKAYLKEKTNGNSLIEIENFHPFPIIISGVILSPDKKRDIEAIILEAFNNKLPVNRYETEFQGKITSLVVNTIGLDSSFVVPVLKWPASRPVANLPVAESPPSEFEFIKKEGNTYRFEPGKHKITKTLTFPEYHLVTIGPGTEIIFEQNGSINSHSPFEVSGTPEQPVIFKSKNGLSGGLLIMKTHQKSQFTNVLFSNLNRPFNGRPQGGCLVFYESDVEMASCRFESIKADNAIQVVRSYLQLENSNFLKCFGNGIQAQYSSGLLRNNNFQNIGNTAINQIGGHFQVTDIKITRALKTGFNGGLNASTDIVSIDIENGDRGIVAEDGANLKISNARIDNVTQGVIVKSEKTGNTLTQVEIQKLQTSEIKKRFTVEQNASLIFNGKAVKPD